MTGIMNEIGIALVGVGEIAQNFHLKTLSHQPDVRLIAVHDKMNSRAKSIAEKFDIPYVCESMDELLALDEIQAVDICTTTDAHSELACRALEAGKNVLIEKPIARSLEETRKILDAEKNSKGRVMVGMTQRFRYDTIMLKNYVHSGELGDVFYVKAGWLQQKRGKEWLDQIDVSGGGVLLDLGISMLDSLMWIYDFAPLHSVKATTFQHKTKTVEDVCVCSLHFKNGSIATLEASWTLFSDKTNFYCDVYGSKGAASINPVRLYKHEGDRFYPAPEIPERSNIAILRKSFESEIRHFINAVKGLSPVHSTTEEAVEIMKILEALYQSAKENREIILD